MDAEFFRAWIAEIAAVIGAQRDHLTQLDAAIGDADHGTNLARGFTAVQQALAAGETPTPGSVLLLTGSTLISKVGGASGPLYGTAFRRAAKALGDKPEADLPALAEALEAALAGVMKLGAAREGEKTMVDALAPAVAAFSASVADGAPAPAAFAALTDAADAGAHGTIALQALKGRASYLGPRSVGHEDPGAASTVLILHALRDVAARQGKMSLPARFRGLPVSEGTAAGTLYVVDAGTPVSASPDEVAAAFAAVTAERFALAGRLRAAGRGQEADIVEVGALIAADPALSEPALAAVRAGEDAASAVTAAAEEQATAMERLANRELAERAGDIRQVAQAVLERLGRGVAAARPDGDFIFVRREVSPADLIELAEAGLVGAVSVAGGASSHAAIIARGLGIPMIAGADAAVLAVPPGQAGLLNADSGELIVSPVEGAVEVTASASPVSASSVLASSVLASSVPASTVLARTADGREIALLCNVASAAETRRGLAAGAVGVGLFRTEIPFAQALAWPTLAEHRAALDPVLGLLAGKPATVRLLDFSGDKIPPFLHGGPSPAGETGGLTALLAHPGALASQLRAVLEAGRDTQLAVLIPMVRSLAEVASVRATLAGEAAALGCGMPRLGIMVELQSTAADAQTFAPAVDFFSIGTNDLTGDVLGLDRLDPAAGPALAAHPRVLTLIERVVGAGREAGIGVSVCGDSAADPRVLPLLVGAGVGTLSVPAARVPRVRSWLARLDSVACAELVTRARHATTAEQVWDLVPRL